MLRSLLRRIVLGRPDGLRSRLLRRAGLRRSCAAADAPAAEADAAPEPAAPVGAPPPAAEAPQGFETVLASDGLAEGAMVEVFAGGKAIALARVDGEVFAMSNVCPHAGGPIGDGTLDGHTVTCPYHGWSFDVRDGTCAVSPDVNLPRYQAVERDGAVSVQVA